jgi:pyridoxal phosphate enzyme (YggS family)
MLTLPQNLAESVRAVRIRIAAAAARYGRNADCVTLVGASKGQPPEAIEAVAGCGLRSFGENYLQEALPKIERLRSLALDWHFIGPLQSNKTRAIAEQFAWVHTLDRLRIAQRLSAQRPHHAAPLEICIQVNISGEPGRAGVAAHEAGSLAAAVRLLPRLRLRGLMVLPPPETELERQRAHFAQLRRLLEALNTQGLGLDTLSMGMSGDLEAAIAEGATIVRIGTALFGPRPPKP